MSFGEFQKFRFFRVIFLHSEHVNRRCSFSAVSTNFDAPLVQIFEEFDSREVPRVIFTIRGVRVGKAYFRYFQLQNRTVLVG